MISFSSLIQRGVSFLKGLSNSKTKEECFVINTLGYSPNMTKTEELSLIMDMYEWGQLAEKGQVEYDEFSGPWARWIRQLETDMNYRYGAKP